MKAIVVTALLLLAACGQAPATGGNGTTESTTSGTSSDADRRFPLTVHRSGGIAGFADDVTIAADGTVTGSTRAGTVDCRLDQTLMDPLRAHAPAAASSGPSLSGADRMPVWVENAFGRTDLGEAADAEGLSGAVSAILSELNQPAEQRRHCR
ncbi:hypothetical protein G9U51_02165 [Calidifontibacter sp. DB0510]|uniref:Lipoprotein n=1 Tax=Metallococcus carri TaxID=1656884 RepID=A0A967AX41_9MICO|nr:hypothetical protein [Metallococcus carri]NHN54584.1 hypothetical protein [Metallococcus carri]NOP36577.1 hypothetical protein [Calidifontibacter sp. DB2511S]